jgi:ribosomal protein S18 acetylase RimI-like enzyme
MTTPTVSIRAITPDDYDSLVELWSASGLEFQTRGRESREAMIRHFEQFPGLSFAAISDGQMVGAVLGTHDGRKGWINRLAVRPDFRRHGVAASLVMACDAAIRASGIEIVAALVEADNQASAAVFRKLGYSDAIEVRYFRKLSHEQA